MIVVPVLMTSCQVSENAKIGPLIAQAAIVNTASTNTQGLPAKREV